MQLRKMAMGTAVLIIFTCIGSTYAGSHRIGTGIHYYKTIDDLDGPYDTEGFSWLMSYQYFTDYALRLEADLKFFGDGYAGSREDVVSPEFLVLYGRTFYGGLGTGMLYADGDLADDPFLIIRGGYELMLTEEIAMDLNLNYRLTAWDGINEIDDQDSDTISLGMHVRYAF